MTTVERFQGVLSRRKIEWPEGSVEDVWLQDLRLDSIEMMGLVVDLEDEFRVILDQRTLLELRTIADLLRTLDRLGAK